MSRILKDEPSQVEPAQTPRPAIQIQVSPALENTLVQLIKEDLQASKQDRNKKDYGYTSKGEKLDFTEWLKALRDLYAGNREPKDTPWKYCSNRSLKIAASVLDMLLSRLLPAVVNEDLLRWRPGEVNDVPKVERISKLMKWWLWVRSKQRPFFEDWIKVILGYGDTVTETSWIVTPVDTGQTEETPIVDEMGQPIMDPMGQPSAVKYRKIDLDEKTESRFYMRDQVYLQPGSKNIQREPVIFEETFLFRELEEGEADGKFINISLLREKIPFDKASVEGLTSEEADRIQSIKIRNYPVKVLKAYITFDADADGFAEDVRIFIAPEFDIYLGGIRVRDLTKSGKRPISYCKLESRLDRPTENDGVGVLEKIKELSEEIDAIFNQLSDSNTLSILKPGFYDPSGDLEAGLLKLAPNKITPVSDPTRNIYFPEFAIKTDQLILAIRLVLEFIERLTAASSYVLGKESEIVGGSGTATRTNAIVSSAEQRFALPAERLRNGAAEIITQHLDILQLNIPPGLEKRVLGEKGEPLFEANELGTQGIAGNYDSYLLPDPSMGSKQTERDLAQMFYSILIQNPITASDPAKLYHLTADFLKAYGKNDDLTKYLGPEPDQDAIDDPEDENTLVIQGEFERVRAQITENHLLHIMRHQDLLNSPSLGEVAKIAPELANQVVQFIQAHIQEHMQMMQTMMGLRAKFGGKSGGEGPAKPEESQGAGEQPGMENAQGPLGQALNAKRAGESGGTQNF